MGWRLCDTDWNHWPEGIGDEATWAVVAADGFAGIEVGVYQAAEELAPDRVRRLRALSAQYDLPIAMLLLSLPAQRWPRGALSGPAEQVAEQAAATARVAEEFALDTIGLWPGADPPGADIRDGLTLAVAAAAPVRVAVEYKPGTAVASVEQALALAAAVPGSGVLLDTAHAYAAGEEPPDVVRRLGDLLWHVHLGDADFGDADADLPVGRRHDFAPFLAALAETDYRGAASLDLYGAVVGGDLTGIEAARESQEHLLAASR